MSTIGAVASLADTIAKWVFSPEGYAHFQRKRELAALSKEVDRAVEEQRWGDLDAINARLEALRRSESR